jgi:hypothetical protein
MRLTKIKNWSWLALLVMVASLLLGSPAIAQTPQTLDKLTFPPLAQVQIPPYERYKLPNGITVYLMEDHRLPSVKGSAILGIEVFCFKDIYPYEDNILIHDYNKKVRQRFDNARCRRYSTQRYC